MDLFFEDLAVGMSASIEKTVSSADVVAFAEVTEDRNPVHLDDAAAGRSVFKARVAHGMLSAGLISAVLGTRMPGPGTIYLGQTLRFRAPVFIGATVTATAEITALDPARRRATLKTTCTVDGKPVIDGEATVTLAARA